MVLALALTVRVLMGQHLTTPVPTHLAATCPTTQDRRPAKGRTKIPAVEAVTHQATVAATNPKTPRPKLATCLTMNPVMTRARHLKAIPVAAEAARAATTNQPMKAATIRAAKTPVVIPAAMTLVGTIPKAKSQRMTTNPMVMKAVADRATLARALGSGLAAGNYKTATARTPAILHPAAVHSTAKW